MKKIITIVVLAITLLTNVALEAKTVKDKSIVAVSEQNIFYFRIKSKIVAGVVEVYDVNKNLLGLEELSERAMIIDFSELPHGRYIIKVKQFNSVKEFNYENQ